MDFSLEFFPPKSEEQSQLLIKAAQYMVEELDPAFVTCTYGAGGSTKDGTLKTATALQRETGCETAAHLSYISTPIRELEEYAHQLWVAGIRRVVALRGDVPKDKNFSDFKTADYYPSTPAFIEALLKLHPFDISVGAYPEKHPDAASLEADITHLKNKCEAGAARAITQFFFDADVFFRFRDKLTAAGVQTNLVPGILPILDYQKMLRFAAACQTDVPSHIHTIFEPLQDNAEAMHEASIRLLQQQVHDLKGGGVKHIHLYTLNRADIIVPALGNDEKMSACSCCKVDR